MKKLLSLLILLLPVAFSIEASAKAEEPQWVDCGDAATFASLVKQNADIRLTADIDLSTLTKEADDYLFNQTFYGRIDGSNGVAEIARNYALQNRQKSAGKDVIIFKQLYDVEITNLLIYQCDFEALDQESGLLSEKCYKSTFDNLTFGDCHVVGDAKTYDCDRIGFAAGYAEESHFRNFFFTDCTMITDGSKLGLVAGDAKDCEFTLCSSNMGCELWADGNLTSYNSAYVGGFCGYADNCTFSKCYNFGAVMSDDDRIGGIVGYGTNCRIEDCKNLGSIMHCKKEGFGRRNLQIAAPILFGTGATFGLLAYLAPGSTTTIVYASERAYRGANWHQYLGYIISTSPETLSVTIATMGFSYVLHVVGAYILAPAAAVCVAVGFGMLVYSLNDPDEMGGIAGTLENGSSVLRCWNGGTVECGDEDCGGIVGHLDGSSVESCYNRTFVKSHGKCTGGIVGYCKNGTVTHNLNVGVVDSESTPMDYIVGETNGTCTVASNYYLYDAAVEGDSRAFTQEALPSGKIALTMNNELIAAGKVAIWCQNLGEDFYPVISDETRPIVERTTNIYSLWQTVKTAEEFYLAVSNPLAWVSVEADLDLNDHIFNLATQAHPFKGVIKGNGHVLKNCHYATTDEYKDGNCALFPYAMDAKFENLILDGITISPLNSVKGDLEDMAIFVAHSTRCEYTNITMRNCNILVNSDEDRLRKIAGLVCHSNYDKITNCTIESTCEFQGHVYVTSTADAYVAGFAATAIESEFVGCHNAAKIKADDDRVAGIVADVTGGKIENCLNSGQIIGQGELGGIAGIANGVSILKCVNVGGIDNDDEDHDTHRGGIVGYIKGESSLIKDCLNFGYINWSTDEGNGSGCIDGEHEKEGIFGTGNYWYCQFNGVHKSSDDDTYTNILSGKYAFNNRYYQYIDNPNGFCTNLPVPIAAAGTVYSNNLCDGTLSYSNIYQSTGAHTGKADQFGNCAICGKKNIGEIAEEIHVCNASDLLSLAQYVNSGTDFSRRPVYLDNDVDMSGYPYTPIGKGFDTPFKGTFDGQGHRIKNLSVKVANDCAGLFGCVSGTTTIKNLIIDSSCTISATGYGAAGLVGCMARESESLSDPISLTLDCCGNEATVNGDINAAGLVGGVYNTETNGNATISITNSYNAGAITGTEQSAALLAYGNGVVKVGCCYNMGSIVGYDSDHSLIRYNSSITPNVKNVYNIVYVAPDEKADATSAVDFVTGKVCAQLNAAGSNRWSQELSRDYSPQLVSDNGSINYSGSMPRVWGTVVLPFNVTYDADNEDYKLYHLTDADSECLTFTEYETGKNIPAGTPMVIRAMGEMGDYGTYEINIPAVENEINTTVTIQNAENAGLPSGWRMNGTYSNQPNMTDIYFLAKNQVWWAESAVTIAPFRAWFTGPALTSTQNAALRIEVSDGSETSVIGEISADGNVNFFDTPIYTIQGQRQQAGQKGLQIRNGKVVFINN